MITADQLVAHAFGDYVVQSHWMATEKTKRSLAAAVHALTYGVAFWLALGASWAALAVIVGTHFVIDRWRLARFVVWFKNLAFCPASADSFTLTATGSPPDAPPFLAVWLLIICDNILHVCINGIALRYL